MAFSDKKGINITSGFKLHAEEPLDIREKVDTLAERDELVTTHAAPMSLRVWVKETSKSYVWNGTKWEELVVKLMDDNISYNMHGSTQRPMDIYGGNVNGQNVSYGGGGNTIVGSGKSSQALHKDYTNPDDKKLVLASDSDINIFTGTANPDKTMGMTIDSEMNVYPNEDLSGSLGTATNRWKELHVDNTEIYGDLGINGDLEVKGDSLLHGDITGESNLHIEGGTDLDGYLDVDGDTNLHGALDVDKKITGKGDLEIQGDTTLDKNLTVKGDTTLNQDLTVKGDEKVEGSFTVDDDITGNSNLHIVGNANIDTNLHVKGNESVDGTLGVTGNATLGGNLEVSGQSTFKDNVTNEKNLHTKGNSTTDGNIVGKSDLTIEGNSTLKGNTDITGTLDVTGKVTAKSDLEVQGNTTLDKNLTVKGDETVTGNSTVGGTLQVTGDSTFKGNATVEKNFEVKGDTTLDKNLTVKGSETVQGTLTSNGKITGNSDLDIKGNTTLNGTLDVVEDTNLNSDLHVKGDETVGGTLDVTGKVTAKNDLEVEGDATFDSDVEIQNNLDVKGDETVGGTLKVTGKVTAENDLDVKGNESVTGTLDVTGKVTAENDLEVKGNTTLDKNLTVKGNETVQGTLTSTGKITGNGGLDINGSSVLNGTLQVKENTTLDKDLNVKGNETVGGTLKVTGKTTLSDVEVTGNMSVGGDIDLDGNLNVTGPITGDLKGNADTATKLQTARKINGTEFDGTKDITTAEWGTARKLTIGLTGKDVNGSAAVTWSLADIGALPIAGGTITGDLTVNGTSTLKGTVTTDGDVIVGGNHTINKDLTVTGAGAFNDDVTIAGTLILTNSYDLAGSADYVNSPALIVGGTQTTAHLELDNNEIHAKANKTTPATLSLNYDGGAVTVGKAGVLTVKDTGITVSGTGSITGDTTIEGTLTLTKQQGLSPTKNNGPALIIGGTVSQQHIEIDNNELQSKSDGVIPSALWLNEGGGHVYIGGGRALDVDKGAMVMNGTGAFTGDVTMDSDAVIKGTLTLTSTGDVSGIANTSPALIVGGTKTTAHIAIDNNEIHAKTDGTTPGSLTLNYDGGTVYVGPGGLSVKGTVTATTFIGNLTGNADTATKLQTGRTINGTTFDGTQDITTANWGTSRKLTIGLAGKDVNGSAAVSWSLAEIGALPIAGGTITGNLTVNGTSTLTGAVTTGSTLTVGTNLTVKGTGSIAGDTTIAGTLTLTKTQDLIGTADNKPALIVGGTSTAIHIEMDPNEIQAKSDGTTPSELFLNADGGHVYIGYGRALDVDKGAMIMTGTGTFTGNVTAPMFVGALQGNADSATKLQTKRKINNTDFDGTGDITTAQWGTARNIGIVNSDGTGTAVPTSVNGSAAVNLKLPATIKATLDGNAGSATKLETARNIDGISFNGSANIHHYGTCETPAATAAKVATVSGGTFTLAEGAMVFVKMTNSNTVANPTLNVNNTGAKSIRRYGTTAPSTSVATSWNAGSVVCLVYDGTDWQMVGFLNTTYSAVTTSANGLMIAADKAKVDYTNIAYGTCATAAATAAKVIDVSGNTNWSLTAGSIIVVKFTATNTAQNPTFNVNNTGAKSVWYNTGLITTGGLGYAGTANRPIIFMYDGTQYVFLGWAYDANTTYTNASLGQGYGTCTTAAATTEKAVTLANYTLILGGVVSVKFTNAVPASATMNINTRGAKAIFHKGSAIKADIIKAGDTATFIYDGTQYHLISLDRDFIGASSTTPKVAAATAAVGTEEAWARGDHVHPVQTTVSGNAGSATKLATARTIQTDLASTSAVNFDGTANITPGVKGTLPVSNGGTGATTLADCGILVGRGSSAIEASVWASAKRVTFTPGATAADGWRRICKVTGKSNYATFLLMITGGYSTGQPTGATISVDTSHTKATMTLLSCGCLGNITQVRLVNDNANVYWLDVYVKGITSGTMSAQALHFLGNVTVSDVVTTNPAPVFSTTVTATCTCVLRATVDQPTITLQDSDGTNKASAVAFTHANITLKLPASIKANVTGALTGNASTATKLATSKTINGTAFDGSDNITTANWGTSRTITIGSTGKSVNGSGNVTWTLDDIGASASGHTHNYLPLAGGTVTGAVTFSSATNAIKLTTAGGSWLTGKTNAAPITVNTKQSESSYHPILKVTAFNDHVVSIGGLKDTFGFQGYYSSRTDNGTDWRTYWDVSTGTLYHNKALNVTGTITGTLSGNASTATTLQTARTIDGISFNGSANVHHYGTCPTAAGTAAKVATVSGGTFTLAEGAMVFVKMANANTVANPTLNVNNTGAKSIRRYGTTAPSTSATSSWNTGSVVCFVYDGTDWQMVGFLNTTYSAVTTSANGLMISTDKAKLNYTNIAYGTSSTAAATAAKVIDISENTNWTLAAGSIIVVKFSATNTASNPTFNVNSTGAKSVWFGTALITTSNLSFAGYANRPMMFMYDGTQYVFLGWAYDNNTWTAFKGATTSAAGTAGYVPAPTAGQTALFFRSDGTWATPTNTTYSNMKGASADTAGSAGLVPAPAAGKQTSFLRGDGTWVVPTNTTYSNMTAATADAAGKAGLVPAPAAGKNTSFLRGDATWANPMGATAIPTNADLNNYKTEGFYYCPANATVATLSNCPTTNAFFLIVGRHAGYHQLIVEYMTGAHKYYNRNFYNNAWGDWSRIYTTLDPPASVATLTTGRAIDGVTFNGSAAITHYGTCDTAAGTAAKTVACTSYTLVTGSRIIVKFTATNTVANPTLNVNSTGAKAIQYRGSAISAGYLAAGRTYEFIYDGANYQLVGDINTNTTYSNMTGASASAAGKAGLVPAPAAKDNTKFLRGDGTWAESVSADHTHEQYEPATYMTYHDLYEFNEIEYYDYDAKNKMFLYAHRIAPFVDLDDDIIFKADHIYAEEGVYSGSVHTDYLVVKDGNVNTLNVVNLSENGVALASKYAAINHTHNDNNNSNDTYMTKTDPTGTGSLSINRKADSEIGLDSIAIGYNTTASGKYSYAEGDGPKSYGIAAHSEGSDTIAYDNYCHAEGRGSKAGVEGNTSIEAAHAEGWFTQASGAYSHAEGYYTKATGRASHAEGAGTSTYTMSEASGDYSHAEGWWTRARGYASHSGCYSSTADGDYSFAHGVGVLAYSNQFVIGHYNGHAESGEHNGTKGTAFVIGNGVPEETTSYGSNACRITYAGAVIGKSAYQSTGADYAEFREWADGNPNNEDRRGYFVTLVDGMIQKANPGDFIEGIVSGHPCVIGNFDECWMGRFLRDEWGEYIYEDVEVKDPNTGKVSTIKTYKVNPDYDPDTPYIPREERPEWDPVGMMGHLSVRDDGTCKVNGYCKVAEGGIATAADRGYRVAKRISSNIIEVVFSMYAQF